jgi:hypothetical protein
MRTPLLFGKQWMQTLQKRLEYISAVHIILAKRNNDAPPYFSASKTIRFTFYNTYTKICGKQSISHYVRMFILGHCTAENETRPLIIGKSRKRNPLQNRPRIKYKTIFDYYCVVGNTAYISGEIKKKEEISCINIDFEIL